MLAGLRGGGRGPGPPPATAGTECGNFSTHILAARIIGVQRETAQTSAEHRRTIELRRRGEKRVGNKSE